MVTRDKIKLVNSNRDKLTNGQRITLSNYKKMFRNIKEDGGRLGGESHTSFNGIKHADGFASRMILKYGMV